MTAPLVARGFALVSFVDRHISTLRIQKCKPAAESRARSSIILPCFQKPPSPACLGSVSPATVPVNLYHVSSCPEEAPLAAFLLHTQN